ncbi:MAG: response regulator [Leptospiraceae bacterium]|nr:response regulator [Leptospiraceae bacterium]
MTENEKITILYVDDEEINLFTFKAIFKKKYEVFTAISAQKGLDLLSQKDISIQAVISDLAMPEMDGLSFITVAKSQYPNLLTFLLTAYDLNDEIQNALNSKLIYQYLSKPLNAGALEKAIANGLQDSTN